MELKRMEHKLTVCKVTDISDVDMTADLFLSGKRMKNYHWYARRTIPHKILLNAMTDGGDFVFRAFLISL